MLKALTRVVNYFKVKNWIRKKTPDCKKNKIMSKF